MAKKKQKKQQGQQFLSPEQYLRQKARTLQIGKCYITENLADVGLGHVIVTRRHTGGRISMGIFMIDTYCLGVKDSDYRLRIEDYELDRVLDRGGNFRECSYDEAHNWVYGAIAYAEEAGISPDKTFQLTQYMLEEDTDAVPLIEYEFGKDGKHFLACHSHLEASRYLPLLKEHLGEGLFDYIIEESEEEEEDEDFDLAKGLERLKNFKDSPMFKTYGPDMEYTYQHPAYPTEMTLETPWLQEELARPENGLYLSDELTDRILALPHDSLRRDLERLIMHIVSQTCDETPEYNEQTYDGTVGTALTLLGEVGNEDTSLDVVLEVMRQSPDFFDYHISDAGHLYFPPTLYLLGQNRLDRLADFVKEDGLHRYAKCEVFPAIVQIALRQPERRQEIVEWFRDILRFATEHISECRAFDSTLAGLMICDLVDLQAKELLPEIKTLHNTGLVDLGCCGSYASVARDICDSRHAGRLDDCILDVHQRFALLRPR